MWYNTIMESRNMIFASGWTQSIDAGGISERQDLASYISDTFKAINGIRPRWWDLREWSLDDLRAEAKSLEDEVVESIKQERAEEARRQMEMAQHHMAVAKAMKPVSPTFKPFTNLKEMLV
jgi:hypothetical protein